MEANELRIGNWIFDETTERQEQVWGIKPDRRNHVMVNDTEIEAIQPIPLTEEWLLRLGSELIESGYDEGDVCIYEYSRFRLMWKSLYNYWYIIESTSEEYLTKIEFVHEWQNFVFAMDDEELTLNK